MNLGAFSISLNVKDLKASRDFYAKLGFEPVGGNVEENWLMLRNGEHVIGLFQGMFEKNILTFNPGWDQNGNDTEEWTDVRDIAAQLEADGILPAEDNTHGSSSVLVTDPDGNPILVDQHRASAS